jgi:hypothetical protein
MTEDPLISVDGIDVAELVTQFERINKKAKKFHDINLLAVKKFKENYQGGYFRWTEMSDKIAAYLSKMVEEEISNVIDQLIVKGVLTVRSKNGQDMIGLRRKKK